MTGVELNAIATRRPDASYKLIDIDHRRDQC